MNKGKPELSERKKRILKAIVEAYIETGEPVGSKHVCDIEDIKCSSATIRNEMAELEEYGYLEKPHTSAGRIPSELGYRFYVDSLLEEYNSATADIDSIKAELAVKKTEVNGILDRASRLASVLTNYTGLALRPKFADGSFMRYDTVYVNQKSFLLVMISAGGEVKTEHIRTTLDITIGEVAQIAKILNEKISGLRAEDVTLPVIMDIEEKAGRQSYLMGPIIKLIYEKASGKEGGELKLEGTGRLLDYPEFSDKEQLQAIMGLDNYKDELMDLVSSGEGNDLKVYIGSENVVDSMRSSALVVKNIRKNGHIVGAIGVIGPRRMEYSRVITLVDALAKSVSDIIKEENLLPEAGGGDGEGKT